jgi:phage shock protein C
MYCTGCGTQLEDTVLYCTQCGRPTAPYAAPVDSAPPRRLRRIVSKKKIAGVCAGFAEYFDLDIALMRMIWVALLLLPPSIGFIGYIIAWIVLPAEQE